MLAKMDTFIVECVVFLLPASPAAFLYFWLYFAQAILSRALDDYSVPFSKRIMVHSTDLCGLGMLTCRLLAGLMRDDFTCPELAQHVTEVLVKVVRSDDVTYQYDEPRLCSRNVLFFPSYG